MKKPLVSIVTRIVHAMHIKMQKITEKINRNNTFDPFFRDQSLKPTASLTVLCSINYSGTKWDIPIFLPILIFKGILQSL